MSVQVLDDVSWSTQQRMLEEQGDIGKSFIKVMVFWCETADKMMEEAQAVHGRQLQPVEAIRLGLPMVETEFGWIEMQYYGQLLLLISMHWVHGVQMSEGLTNLEMKVFADAVRMKQIELQHLAEAAVDAN